jgi:hypothetical protein
MPCADLVQKNRPAATVISCDRAHPYRGPAHGLRSFATDSNGSILPTQLLNDLPSGYRA